MTGTSPEPPASSSTGIPASRAASQTNHPPMGPRTSIPAPIGKASTRYGDTSPPTTRWTVISTRPPSDDVAPLVGPLAMEYERSAV
jgi:hypothetical protein